MIRKLWRVNPSPPSAAKYATQCKILDLRSKGSSEKKKIPMSVETMSRWTKRAYLRLCPEKLRKKEFRQ